MGKKQSGHEQMVRTNTVNEVIFDMPGHICFIKILFLFSHLQYSPLLVSDKSIEDGVYVFPLKDATRQPCVYDVSMLRENAAQFQICFTLLSDESENTAWVYYFLFTNLQKYRILSNVQWYTQSVFKNFVLYILTQKLCMYMYKRLVKSPKLYLSHKPENYLWESQSKELYF